MMSGGPPAASRQRVWTETVGDAAQLQGQRACVIPSSTTKQQQASDLEESSHHVFPPQGEDAPGTLSMSFTLCAGVPSSFLQRAFSSGCLVRLVDTLLRIDAQRRPSQTRIKLVDGDDIARCRSRLSRHAAREHPDENAPHRLRGR